MVFSSLCLCFISDIKPRLLLFGKDDSSEKYCTARIFHSFSMRGVVLRICYCLPEWHFGAGCVR